ncbi:MAG: hypothetical protein IJB86_07710 [Clostridia bacterium]|nr:hypothetical protein [Clostridia bacterium]
MGKLIAFILSLYTTFMGTFNIYFEKDIRIPTFEEVVTSGFEQEPIELTLDTEEPAEEYTKKEYGRFARDMELNYWRSCLDTTCQRIYDEVLRNLVGYKDTFFDFGKSDFTEDQFWKATRAIHMDYPETRMYMTLYYEYDCEMNKAVCCEVRCGYLWRMWQYFSPRQMEMTMNAINLVCDSIIARMPDGTNAEKYEYLAREIARKTTYTDNDEKDYLLRVNYDFSYSYMNGILLKGKGLCQAYAQAYQYLCHRAGLWNITVSGGNHEWNMVKLEDGSTYHVDVTWADGVGGFDEYYFLMTQEEAEYDHTIKEGYPEATGESLR